MIASGISSWLLYPWMSFSSEIPTVFSAVTSTKTLVGEDSPEFGTSAILLIDLVCLGVAGSELVSVAMIIFVAVLFF